MDEITPNSSANHITLAADIVSAYVANNSIPASELASLLASVHSAVSGLTSGGSAASAADAVEKPTPAQIKKSITHDALISFEDGKPYKTLRRHLTLRGLTPEAYRAKHGLSADYPMTAASYSAQRSELARALGLGNSRKGKTKAAAKATEAEETISEVAAETKPKRAGRPHKAASGK